MILNQYIPLWIPVYAYMYRGYSLVGTIVLFTILVSKIKKRSCCLIPRPIHYAIGIASYWSGNASNLSREMIVMRQLFCKGPGICTFYFLETQGDSR